MCIGTCWPTLAREWNQLHGCQVVEDCQRNFKWPLSPSPAPLCPPLCFTLLLSLSASLCRYLLAVFISCSESVNLMKRKVKHLAGIKKHPRDGDVWVCGASFHGEETYPPLQRETGGRVYYEYHGGIGKIWRRERSPHLQEEEHGNQPIQSIRIHNNSKRCRQQTGSSLFYAVNHQLVRINTQRYK